MEEGATDGKHASPEVERPGENSSSLMFEDFFVGQRFTSAARVVSEDDLSLFTKVSGDRHPMHTDPQYAATTRFGKPVLHGPFGLAAFFGLLYELDLVTSSIEALLDTNWRYLGPIYVGDALSFELTVTRCRRTSAGDTGVVGRHVVLRNQHGERVQEGTTAMLVRAREARRPEEDPVGRAYCTVPWGKELARRLADDQLFTSATATWDGTIGLKCGDDEVHLRVYRGRVIDVTARTPHGATFTVKADEVTWTNLLVAETNDFIRRTMRDEFEVAGSAYEYLRLTKAVMALIGKAQQLAGEVSIP